MALPDVRSVIAPPQSAQKQMPVSSVGPLTVRPGTTIGLRDLSSSWTASKVSRSISGGTGTVTVSAWALGVPSL
ncbi:MULTISPECIES: hypothetical protein [unclassified Roseitalea]|uniref:hypothetical protein n=1 Tax=unclassified Roseitalea TaxID=2639107 RepID=UPI00274016F6|nr:MULTISPECIES: hypothetical protein [unclassified Roseitalea]